MVLSLQAPLFLLLLIPLAILALIAGPRLGAGLGRETAGRRAVVLALRCASLALLIVALAQPRWAATGAGVPILFVVDTSASITPAMRADEAAWLRGALDTAPAGTVRGVVLFAGSARLLPPPSRQASPRLLLAQGAALDEGQTDVEGAIRLALGAVPDGARLVVLTDGLQTAGAAAAAAAVARARHVTIDTVALGTAGVGGGRETADAALTRLQTLGTVHQGDAVPLLLTVRSTIARRATLSLTQDGQVAGRETLSLQPGDNPFLATLQAPGPGWHVYHAAVSMAGDTVPQNNALDTTTYVTERPQVLVVAAGRAVSPFVALLHHMAVAVKAVAPRSAPAAARALDGYDAVVLDDVPTAALAVRQIAALETAVRIGGLGLLALGGPHSFTLGGYTGTPLDRLLPVLSATPGSLQPGNIALELILDRSGSMNNLAGDQPKILMAQAAANIAVDFSLQHKDELGIVSFDYYPHLLVQRQKVIGAAVAAHIHATVNGLTADGGTNIYAALQLGLTQVLQSDAPYKHVILMTDGVSEPARYDGLLTLLRRQHATLSTVGLGSDAAVDLLRYLSGAGKGRFYYTADASALPHIFANEARLSAGQSSVIGTIPVAIGASSPVVRSLGSGPLPPVHGYVATALKPDATALLYAHVAGRRDDPLLAQWQYGLGRVLAWTPGATVGWSGGWFSGESSMWEDAVHWTLRGARAPVLAPRLLAGSSPARIEIDTLRNSGAFVDLARLSGSVQTPAIGRQPLAFDQVAPGQYQASLPDGGPGIYRLTVTQGTTASSLIDAAVAVPYPREYLPRPPDLALLSALSEETDGRILTAPGRGTLGSGIGAAGSTSIGAGQDLWWPLAALALVIFLFEVTLRLLARGRAAASPLPRAGENVGLSVP